MNQIGMWAAAVLGICAAGCGGMGAWENVSAAETAKAAEMAETAKPAEQIPSQAESESASEEGAEGGEETVMKLSVASSEYEVIFELNGSGAARQLYGQLPLTVEAQPFSSNEITFYPPERLDTENTPLSGGETGSLAYYAPWGDVVLFYAPCSPNGSLYGLGMAVSGGENISRLAGTLTVSAVETEGEGR